MLFRAIIIYTSLELLTEKRNNTNYNNNTLNTIDIIKIAFIRTNILIFHNSELSYAIHIEFLTSYFICKLIEYGFSDLFFF